MRVLFFKRFEFRLDPKHKCSPKPNQNPKNTPPLALSAASGPLAQKPKMTTLTDRSAPLFTGLAFYQLLTMAIRMIFITGIVFFLGIAIRLITLMGTGTKVNQASKATNAITP